MKPIYYNQVFSNLEKDIPAKPRLNIIKDYFQKYLPSFSTLYPEDVILFIDGNISYDAMLKLFNQRISLQVQRQVNRIYDFRKDDERRYGNRSFAPTPLALTRIALEREFNRFKEVFGPRGGIIKDRVPGTQVIEEGIVSRIGSLGAW